MFDIENPEAHEGREPEPEFVDVEDEDVERLSQDRGLVGFALGTAIFEDALHKVEGEPETGRAVELFRALYDSQTLEGAARVHPDNMKDFKYYVGLVAQEYYGSLENYERGIVSDDYRFFIKQGKAITQGAKYNFERRSRATMQTGFKGAKGIVTVYEKAWEMAELRARGIELGDEEHGIKKNKRAA